MNNVRALGGSAIACGVVGLDPAGRQLLRLLEDLGVDQRGVFRSRGEATTRKTRILAHQQQVVRLDREDEGQRQSRAAARARGFLLANLWKADVVVLSDYGKGFITPELLNIIAGVRQRRPFPLVIDPKHGNFAHYHRPSLVTPNRDEASHASGVEVRDLASLARAGRALLEKWQAEAVLITRGEEGMSLFTEGGKPRHFPTVAQHVYDVTGAGDTVIATCALALAAGASLPAAAVLANHAAGIVVGEVGTSTVSARQLRADLRQRSPHARKI
jgi:rfaE bifunctional protein kinase chain/domain